MLEIGNNLADVLKTILATVAIILYFYFIFKNM